MRLRALAVVLVAAGAAVAGIGDGFGMGDGGGFGVGGFGSFGKRRVPPTATITVPSADPEAASGSGETVSGTTTGTPDTVTWATACVAGPTACSTGAGTFSCTVTQTQDCAASQTVTVTATSSSGTGQDTTALLFPALDVQAGATTPLDLPDTLTINSVALTLVLACDAKDADVNAGTWVCRTNGGTETLTEVGTQTAPHIGTPFHATDSAERLFQCGARAWESTSTTLGNIGTDDIVTEYVGRTSTANADSTVSTANDNTTAAGFKVYQTTTGFRTYIGDGTNGFAAGVGLARSAFFGHEMTFIDRSENSTDGAHVYANGVQGTGGNPSAVTGNVSSSAKITFCADPDNGDTDNNSAFASIRIWKCTGCMPGGASNPAEWAPIARERTAIAFGVTPTLAAGLDAPSTMTRSTSGYADVVDGLARTLFPIHANAPRVAIRASAETAFTGYMSEPATTNLVLQSQVLGTTWAAITAGDNVLANSWTPPDVGGGATGDDVDGNNSDAEHGLRQAVTLTAVTHTFSAFARNGSQTVVALRDNTVANALAFFDLTACDACALGQNCATAVGTTGAGVSLARASNWPIDSDNDGDIEETACRVSIAFTGTAAAHDMDLLCASADNDLTYLDADAAADCGWWGVEVEAFPTPTSYQATTTASVTRSADDLRFDGASHYAGSPTTVDVAVLCPSYDVEASNTFVSIGTSTTDYGRIGINATNDRPNTDGANAGAQWDFSGSSGDVADGTSHTLRDTWVTNDVEGFFDGTSFGTDASNTLPTSASSSVYLGTRGSTAQQPACLIKRMRVWGREVSIAEAP